jgi:hypothetical protein
MVHKFDNWLIQTSPGNGGIIIFVFNVKTHYTIIKFVKTDEDAMNILNMLWGDNV